MDIVLLFSGSDPESKAEFHFPNNPTTYWTYSKYVTNEALKAEGAPSLSPGFNSTLPANLPSSLISPSIHIPGSMPDPPSGERPIPRPTLTASSRLVSAHSSLRRYRRYRRAKELLTFYGFWQKVKRRFAAIVHQ
jgi:hypothetical protein